MFAKVCALALLVAAVSASPASTGYDNNNNMINYGDAMEMFLSAWKKMLPCGFAADNIPPMSPFTIDHYSFSYGNGSTNLTGHLHNLRISGLNNFEILSGSFEDSTMTARFDVMYPEIQVLGSYELEGTLGIAGFPLPIHQNVLLNKRLQDYRYVGEYTFAQNPNNTNGLIISDFKVSLHVGNIMVANWNKYFDIATNNYMNNFIASFSMLMGEEINPYINALFNKYALPTINGLLSDMSMTELITYFVDQAAIWNSVPCRAH